MALLMYEGFTNWSSQTAGIFNGAYGTSGGMFWSNFTALNFFNSVGGGRFLNCGNTGAFVLYNSAVKTTAILGFRGYFSPVATTQNCITFFDVAGATQSGLGFNSSNQLILWRGTTATVLATGTTKIYSTTENYYEIKIPFGNSVNVEVRLNGVTELTATGVDTTNTANQSYLGFGNPGTTGGSTVGYCDIYLCDDSGPAPYNDFLGICRVEVLYGTSNNVVTWTPLASTNVSQINEANFDGDTSYNSTSTTVSADTFNHGSLSLNPLNLYSVKVQSFSRKTDIPIRNYRNKLLSGAATGDGTLRSINTGYQLQEDYYQTDPNTGLAWASATAVNNTKIGYELNGQAWAGSVSLNGGGSMQATPS